MKRRFAAFALSLLLAGASAQEPTSACFNGDPNSRIVVWNFEGYADWKAARAGTPSILVFSFTPGKYVYEAQELVGCFYMPGDHTKNVYRCTGGNLRIVQYDLPSNVTGEFRLALTNGTSKALAFKAPYCPPFKREEPAQRSKSYP